MPNEQSLSLSPVPYPKGKGDLEQKSFPLREDLGEAEKFTKEFISDLL